MSLVTIKVIRMIGVGCAETESETRRFRLVPSLLSPPPPQIRSGRVYQIGYPSLRRKDIYSCWRKRDGVEFAVSFLSLFLFENERFWEVYVRGKSRGAFFYYGQKEGMDLMNGRVSMGMVGFILLYQC